MFISKLLKEPLFHFIILGGLLYLASIMSGYDDAQTQRIVVSEGQIRHLATLYKKTWQRKPTREELQALIQEYIKGQAAYYEGMSMGLEKDDVVVTRRLRQKVDFIAEESLERPVVTDDILLAYLQKNPDKFLSEPTLSIRQVYFESGNSKLTNEEKIEGVLSALIQSPDEAIEGLGQRYVFKPYYINQSVTELKHVFGKAFVDVLLKAKEGAWFGPVQSGFGNHLVYIDKKQEAYLPELSVIYDAVFNEWQNSLRQQSLDRYYAKLLKRYPATVHWPADDSLIVAKKSDDRQL